MGPQEVYFSLELARRRALKAAVVRLMLRSGERALGWCEHLLVLPPSRRLGFVVSLLQSEGYRVEPDHLTSSDLSTLVDGVPKKHWRRECARLGRSLHNGMTARFFLQSLPLARDRWGAYLRDRGDCADFHLNEAQSWLPSKEESWLWRELWAGSARCPELPGWLRSFALPELTRYLLELVLAGPFDEDAYYQGLMPFWISQADSLRKQLVKLEPPYRMRFLQELRGWVFEWEKPGPIRANQPGVYAFLANLCRAPMSTHELPWRALFLLSQQRRLPDNSYIASSKPHPGCESPQQDRIKVSFSCWVGTSAPRTDARHNRARPQRTKAGRERRLLIAGSAAPQNLDPAPGPARGCTRPCSVAAAGVRPGCRCAAWLSRPRADASARSRATVRRQTIADPIGGCQRHRRSDGRANQTQIPRERLRLRQSCAAMKLQTGQVKLMSASQ